MRSLEKGQVGDMYCYLLVTTYSSKNVEDPDTLLFEGVWQEPDDEK